MVEAKGKHKVARAELQRSLGLRVDADAPLAIFVSRITQHKMADVLLQHLPELMRRAPRLDPVESIADGGLRGLDQQHVAEAEQFAIP